MNLNRKTAGAFLIAVLAVTAMGLAAATIDSSYSADVGTGSGPEFQDDDGSGGSVGDSSQDSSEMAGVRNPGGGGMSVPSMCIPLLTQTPVILALVLAIVAVVGLSYRRMGFIGGAFSAYLVGLPTLIGYSLVTQCTSAGSGGAGGSPVGDIISRVGGLDSAVNTPIPPVLIGGVFAFAAVVAVVALVFATGNEEIEPPEQDADDDDPDLAEFAAAAGAAADRIETADADVDNSVYRAWWEMTDLLDASSPESSTPGEFAEAAIEAGMDRDDVDQLTQLFEDVRYGGMDPEPREELALDTLRQIEQRYGDATGSEDDDGAQ